MRIAILVFPGVQMLEVGGPFDVMSAGARLSGRLDAYRLEVISLDEKLVRASNGMTFQADWTIDTVPGDIDTLLVAGGPQVRELESNQRLMHWLVRQADVVRRIGSICSGALLLASAGLLDGRRATTHWNASADLARRFPKVLVEHNAISVRDGSRYSSAGVTAGMDLALSLVEEDLGRDVALQVARELMMFMRRPGGQLQFSAALSGPAAEGGEIRALQKWVQHNFDKDLPVPLLASQAGMSVRNFTRQFKAQTKMTPSGFLAATRIDAARRMLEGSSTPLERVAVQAGFHDLASLRRAFVHRLGVTPTDYRRRFQK
jgi:transcriptional regulator GlxA family with amidase domain